ncbi:MAG: SIMPL domain-containing protein [Candidatus Pacearchaeota archaeon]|nr:SIMPL domain-containing protein [Candidatus Pacearchaeota archaeon]
MPKEMHNSIKITLIIVATIAVLSIAGMIFYQSNFSSTNTISVNGQGVEKAVPDLVSVYFSVDTKNSTSKQAEDANSLIVSRLRSYIVSLGFSEEDLKTVNYNIYPDYDYTTGKTSGYRASHSLSISFSVSEKDKITGVIDAGTTAGAGISYINFELSPQLEQQYKATAIQTASEDARVKAEAIAEGFNKNLGRLVSVSLDSFNYYPTRVYDAAESGASSEEAKTTVAGITPSETEVSAYVTAVYRLS